MAWPVEQEGQGDAIAQGHASVNASPIRRASNARTSVAYCRPSSKGIRCNRWLSVGSLIQPSIGMALSLPKDSNVSVERACTRPRPSGTGNG